MTSFPQLTPEQEDSREAALDAAVERCCRRIEREARRARTEWVRSPGKKMYADLTDEVGR